MAPVTSSNQELLQIISGLSAIQTPVLIQEELKSHRRQFLEGLLSYKENSSSSETKLKGDKNVSKLELNFLLRLSKFLDLDAVQCQELFECYLLNAFRGTGQQLQSILKDDRSIQALMLKVWEYYQGERVLLLHSLKHVLTFYRDQDHPYQVQYTEFVEGLQRAGLLDKLLDQYQKIFGTLTPNRENRGPLMTERQSIKWSIQSLREQCELLEIILLYVREMPDPSSKLLQLAKMFKQQGFGTRQPYRHLLDAEDMAHRLTDRIGFLNTLLLIECMDLYPLLGEEQDESLQANKLFTDQKLAKDFQVVLHSLGSLPAHGPILLAYVVFHSVARPDQTSPLVQKFGQQAMQLKVFQYMHEGLTSNQMGDNTLVSAMCHSIVYALLSLVLTIFQEDTVGGSKELVDLAAQLLKQEHLCEEFWTTDVEGGLSVMLQSAVSRFPMDFSPLLKLLSALSTEGSKQVFEFVEQLPSYTEPLDNNRSEDIESTGRKGVWKLLANKVVFMSGKHCKGFVIPMGTLGELIHQPEGPPLIRWAVEFNGWQLFQCLIDWLILSISKGNLSEIQSRQVTEIMNLLTQVLESDWSISARLQPIMGCIYPLISSLCVVPNPPLTLLASCIKCLAVMADNDAQHVWQSLQQTTFLPHTGNVYTQVAEAVSGAGILPADYGKILCQHEMTCGSYPVTLEFLKLVKALLKGLAGENVSLATSQDLLACVIFVQKEIFANFQKWRYANFTHMEQVGQLSLEVCHTVLHVLPILRVTEESQTDADRKEIQSVSIREACVHAFLHTSAGEALLAIAGTGVDTLEQKIIEQGSFDGAAERLSQLIKLSLSILNRLLLLKPANRPPCPLEHYLTSHTTGLPHQPHLIAVMASYIYHRHDPRLSTLATLLLRRLALAAPMSIFGCLGNQAAALRDMYLSRLQTHSENVRLKVGILEFLTAAVETQPGLSELFLNLEPAKKDSKDQASTSTARAPVQQKEMTLGKISCLHAVLDIIEEPKQGTTHCPPDLHCAALGLLRALWHDCRETALTLLRKRPKFWQNVAAPLFQDLPVPEGEANAVRCQIKTVAHAFLILALECFYVGNNTLDDGLQNIFQKLKDKNRYVYWSQYLCELLESNDGHGQDIEEYLLREHEVLVLLQGWRMFLLVAASQSGNAIQLTDVKTKCSILNGIAMAIHNQTEFLSSVFNAKACSLLTGLYLALLTRWKSCQNSQWKHAEAFVSVIEKYADAEQGVLQRSQSAVMATLTTLLQDHRKQDREKGLSIETIETLLPLVCVAMQQSTTLYNKPNTTTTNTSSNIPTTHGTPTTPRRQRSTMDTPGRNRSTMDTPRRNRSTMDTPSRSLLSEQPSGVFGDVSMMEESVGLGKLEENQVDVEEPVNKHKQSLPVVAAYLLDELLLAEKDQVSAWMPLLRQHSVLPLLLSTLQDCMQAQKGIHYVEAVLLLLTDLATIEESAESVRIGGLTQHTCLALLHLYQQNGDSKLAANTRIKDLKVDKPKQHQHQPQEVISWPGIYRLCVSLNTSMLATLHHAYLTDALNFFGVHRERIVQCLESVQLNQSQACLLEAQATTLFLYQMAHYKQDWRFHMPTELDHLLGRLTQLCHTCVALIMRPRLLQRLLEMSARRVELVPQQLSHMMRSTPVGLQRQVSFEQAEVDGAQTDPKVMKTQAKLLVILNQSLSALRYFSPDLLELLLNQSMTVSDYPILFELGFSAPALGQDTPATFGTFLSAVNMSIEFLNKMEGIRNAPSPSKSPTKAPTSRLGSKEKKDAESPLENPFDRSVLFLIMESGIWLIMTQGLRCLKETNLPLRDRQLLKRELSTELSTFLHELQRYFRRGGPASPSSASPSTSILRNPLSASGSKSSLHSSFSDQQEQVFFRVLQMFIQQILR
ncbi:LOW QUALITY PROTEIN: nucleoporin NUP188-like [Amphiura filiformis]|uniref:LOW QUALITY PROTEIN: nucleoporin NUP188-like n=1 Tax=Amphiura filiformis TaxID=82378 RepID=UPI003B20D32D